MANVLNKGILDCASVAANVKKRTRALSHNKEQKEPSSVVKRPKKSSTTKDKCAKTQDKIKTKSNAGDRAPGIFVDALVCRLSRPARELRRTLLPIARAFFFGELAGFHDGLKASQILRDFDTQQAPASAASASPKI